MTDTPKLDRRVVRTRAMLRQALLELVNERGYDALTVQEITDRADLRRATFYLHYHDKEALLLDALQTTFDALTATLEPVITGDVLAGKTQVSAFQATFEHVAVHHQLYHSLLTGQSGGAIGQRIQAYLANHIAKALANTSEAGSPVPFTVLAQYIAGAEVAMVHWWLAQNRPYSPREMAVMLHRMVIGGVASVLGNKIRVEFE